MLCVRCGMAGAEDDYPRNSSLDEARPPLGLSGVNAITLIAPRPFT